MVQLWSKLPKWGQWVSSVVAGLVALYGVAVWAKDNVDSVITTESERLQLEAHHNEDVKRILDHLATKEAEAVESEKRSRLSNNYQRLGDLQRELVGEKYNTEGERLLIVEDIKRLQKDIRCDETKQCD